MSCSCNTMFCRSIQVSRNLLCIITNRGVERATKEYGLFAKKVIDKSSARAYNFKHDGEPHG